MKRWIRRLLCFVGLPAAALAGLFVLVVGPWPTYADSRYREQRYYTDTIARIDAGAALSERTATPGALQAGWAERDMTPPIGAPLAGYSGRPNGKRCTSVHDPLFARAIVLSDGADTVALVGSDLLMTTLNVAEKVWAAVARETPLTQHDILFTSSHSHCATGGFLPGLVGAYSAGEFDPALVDLIADAIAGAIADAWRSMAPAAMALGRAEAPEYIYNRTEVEGEDASLRYFVLRKTTGEQCWAVRYSAHPTVLPQEFLGVSAEYPGVLCQTLRARTGAMTVFLGGAVGAMGPVPPEGGDDLAQMTRMGEALAARILEQPAPAAYLDRVDIASVGCEAGMPPMQARPTPGNWRLSPLLGPLLGVPRFGWIQGVRVGGLLLLGLPYDSGAAIAAGWESGARARGLDLWVGSHCIGYCGYLTPDRHYDTPPAGYDQYYEWRLMNWFGPNQEAMYGDLKDRVIERLAPPPAH